MSKNIELDKFYTPIETANKCIEVTNKALEGLMEITEYLEPSAGNGSFSSLMPNCLAYDIEPQGEGILKADYLSLDLKYKKGRVVIGNPPFGDRNNLARSFYKKSVNICDAVAFILPISQFKNTDSLYEFDLIESVDLGVLEYSGMKVHCCFNVYIKPKGTLNKKPKIKTNIITVYRDDEAGYTDLEYDLCIFRRGASSGKEKFVNQHTQTYKIIVNDRSRVEEVKSKILSFDWLGFKMHQSAPSIYKNDIYRLFV